MSGSLPDIRATARPAGLIDTLQAGFNTVNRNAWLLLIPLAIDLFLWLGPQVTVGTAFDSWMRAAVVPPGSDGSLARLFEQSRRQLLELMQQSDGVSRFNLLSLIAMPFLGIPSFRSGSPGDGLLLPVGSLMNGALAGLGAMLIGLVISAFFYGLLAQAVREASTRPRAFLNDVGKLTAAVAGLFGLMLFLVVVVALPAIGVVGLLSTVAPAATAIVGPLFVGILLWAFVYLFFTTDALFVARVSPIVAMQHSIVVVRSHFWPTLGFIGLVMVISLGMGTLWQEIARNLRVVGTIVAIVGHIYISSGLAAATMTYYRERSEQLRAQA
jgi:hypothetical protein